MYLDSLKEWLSNNVFGFYESCQITVCGFLKYDNTVENIFTNICFEETELKDNEPIFITEKNERFGKNLRLVIMQQSLKTAEAIKIFESIESGNDVISINNNKLKIGQLNPAPFLFVPSDSSVTIPYNRILKNNFRGGSMVFEFYKDNKNIADIDRKQFEKALIRIRELIPIDLFTLSDKVGCVVFQLPQQIAYCKLETAGENIICSAILNERVKNYQNYRLTGYVEHDKMMVNYQSIQGNKSRVIQLKNNYVGGRYNICLINTLYNVPVLQQSTSKIECFENTMVIKGDEDTVRTIINSKGQEEVIINSQERMTFGKSKSLWIDSSLRRRYRERMQMLIEQKEFLQYGINVNEHEKAIRTIRELMNESAETEVFLWDPYLSAEDLLETWYYTNCSGLHLRAVCSSKAAKGIDNWIEKQRKTLKEGSNQYGINIEWRIQHDEYGYGFHDRFLIVQKPDIEPKVWSLGTSVNSLGKKHHIIQLVSNPGYIADAFDELWNELEDESCQIWNSRKEK